MKYYLIGAFSKGKEAQRYFDSLSVLGDKVEPIIVQYQRQGKWEKVNKPDNVILIKYKKEYPGNTGKHKDFREILSSLLIRDTWCIFTDMHDVIFQAPLPKFPQADALVVSEAVNFSEVDYWSEIFPQDIKDYEVFNVGSFAMKRDKLLEFWEYIHTNWMEFYSWYKTATIPRIGNGDAFPFNIPFHERVKVEMAIMFNSHYDTLAFNRFIRKLETKQVDNLFGVYAFQVDKKVIVNLDGKLLRDGKPVAIAHYNGSSKKWMPKKGKNK